MRVLSRKDKISAHRIQEIDFLKGIRKILVKYSSACLVECSFAASCCPRYCLLRVLARIVSELSIPDITWLQDSFKWVKPCNSKICSSNQKKLNSNLHSKFLLGSPIQLALFRAAQHYSSADSQNCCHASKDVAP